MFIALSIHDSQKWKQNKYPSTGEWINKMWYVYKMRLSSAIKRNELPTTDRCYNMDEP